jgi:hypothetical protein
MVNRRNKAKVKSSKAKEENESRTGVYSCEFVVNLKKQSQFEARQKAKVQRQKGRNEQIKAG